MIRRVLAALAALAIGWAPATQPASPPPPQTFLLVAKRHLADPLYRATVLVVRRLGDDQHVGVIINRPTRMTLGQLFPQHKPSQRVRDPVYLGGPSSPSVIFAIVHRPASPLGKSLRLMPDLYMAFETATVDSIIEKEPDHAKFVAGLVTWQPGELREEIRRGAWHLLEAEPKLVLRKPDGLWEELVRRAELRAAAI